jgi:hypothetical protein
MSMTAEHPSPGKDSVPRAVEVSPDSPCPICHGTEDCRVSGHEVACVRLDNGLGQRKRSRDGTQYVRYDLSTFRYVPEVEKALDLLKRYFLNRTDRVAVFADWDKPNPAVGEDKLEGLLRSHLTGQCYVSPRLVSKNKPEGWDGKKRKDWRVGSYGPAEDGTTKWVVIDFDGGGDHSAPLADATAVALSVRSLCLALGVPVYLEMSKSGKGWHLWVFFDPPAPAYLARSFAFAVLPHDALLTDGNFADPHKGFGLEVFPKNDDLGGGRTVGSQVWLPWYCKAGKGGNVFYTMFGERGLLPSVPDDFKPIGEGKLVEALAAAVARQEGAA